MGAVIHDGTMELRSRMTVEPEGEAGSRLTFTVESDDAPWTEWKSRSRVASGSARKRERSRTAKGKPLVSGGGRESNPPSGVSRCTGFEGMSSLPASGKPMTRAFAFRSRPRACKDL